MTLSDTNDNYGIHAKREPVTDESFIKSSFEVEESDPHSEKTGRPRSYVRESNFDQTTPSQLEESEIDQGFDQNTFDQSGFDQQAFDQMGFEQGGFGTEFEPEFEQREFEQREFEQREFEQREFEQREFDQQRFPNFLTNEDLQLGYSSESKPKDENNFQPLFKIDLPMVRRTMDGVNRALGVDLGGTEVTETALMDQPNYDSDGDSKDSGNTKGEMSHVRLICDACGYIVVSVATAVLQSAEESFKESIANNSRPQPPRPPIRKKRGGVLGFKELANRANLSPWHFHRVFRFVTGVTPKAYGEALWEYLMIEAKFDLENEDLTIDVNSKFEPKVKENKKGESTASVQSLPDTNISDTRSASSNINSSDSNSTPNTNTTMNSPVSNTINFNRSKKESQSSDSTRAALTPTDSLQSPRSPRIHRSPKSQMSPGIQHSPKPIRGSAVELSYTSTLGGSGLSNEMSRQDAKAHERVNHHVRGTGNMSKSLSQQVSPLSGSVAPGRIRKASSRSRGARSHSRNRTQSQPQNRPMTMDQQPQVSENQLGNRGRSMSRENVQFDQSYGFQNQSQQPQSLNGNQIQMSQMQMSQMQTPITQMQINQLHQLHQMQMNQLRQMQMSMQMNQMNQMPMNMQMPMNGMDESGDPLPMPMMQENLQQSLGSAQDVPDLNGLTLQGMNEFDTAYFNSISDPMGHMNEPESHGTSRSPSNPDSGEPSTRSSTHDPQDLQTSTQSSNLDPPLNHNLQSDLHHEMMHQSDGEKLDQLGDLPNYFYMSNEDKSLYDDDNNSSYMSAFIGDEDPPLMPSWNPDNGSNGNFSF